MAPISQNSKAVFTLGTLVTIGCSALALTCSAIGLTWKVAEAKNQILNELAAIRQVQASQWGINDHGKWAARLERANRGIGLIVPDVNDRPGT